MSSQSHGRFWRVFGAPMAIGLASLIGLLAALLGDNVWDAVSWIALGIPVSLVFWYSIRGRGLGILYGDNLPAQQPVPECSKRGRMKRKLDVCD